MNPAAPATPKRLDPKYLDDEAKREKLRDKHAPLVPVFVAALDTIGEGLGIGDNGIRAVRTRFEALSNTLNNPM